MRRFALLLVTLLSLASVGLGQLLLPTTSVVETPGALEIRVKIAFWTPPYDSVYAEFLAIATPGLSPSTETLEPPLGPWDGPHPPRGLNLQWLFSPVSAPSGPVYSLVSTTGTAVPAQASIPGVTCAWGYQATGSILSGPMEIGVLLSPYQTIPAAWVYLVGYTNSGAYGAAYRSVWARL
jgi:hypothetical protein